MQDIGQFHKDHPIAALSTDAALAVGAAISLTPEGRKVGSMIMDEAANAGRGLMRAGDDLAAQMLGMNQFEPAYAMATARASAGAAGRVESVNNVVDKGLVMSMSGAQGDSGRGLQNLGGLYGPLSGDAGKVVEIEPTVEKAVATPPGRYADLLVHDRVYESTPQGNVMRALDSAEQTASNFEMDQIAFMIGKFPENDDHGLRALTKDMPRIQALLPEMIPAPSKTHALLQVSSFMNDDNIVCRVADYVRKYVRP